MKRLFLPLYFTIKYRLAMTSTNVISNQIISNNSDLPTSDSIERIEEDLQIHEMSLSQEEIQYGEIICGNDIAKNTNPTVKFYSRGIHHYKLAYEYASIPMLDSIKQLLDPKSKNTDTYKKEELELLRCFFTEVTDILVLIQLSIMFLKLYAESFNCDTELQNIISSTKKRILRIFRIYQNSGCINKKKLFENLKKIKKEKNVKAALVHTTTLPMTSTEGIEKNKIGFPKNNNVQSSEVCPNIIRSKRLFDMLNLDTIPNCNNNLQVLINTISQKRTHIVHSEINNLKNDLNNIRSSLIKLKVLPRSVSKIPLDKFKTLNPEQNLPIIQAERVKVFKEFLRGPLTCQILEDIEKIMPNSNESCVIEYLSIDSSNRIQSKEENTDIIMKEIKTIFNKEIRWTRELIFILEKQTSNVKCNIFDLKLSSFTTFIESN